MTRSPQDDVVENPLTSSRAVRLALTKAANDSAGLVLTVTSVAEDVAPLDTMLDDLEDGLMLVGLHRDDRLIGLIALDMQLRAAVLEMETTGFLAGQPAVDRTPTHTDMMMCDRVLADFLTAFPQSVRGTDFEGWGDNVVHQDRIDSTRIAGLLLDDCAYRVVRMAVQMGSVDRQGLLLMALPLGEPAIEDVPVVPDSDWGTLFPQAVQQAPTTLTALLHRFSVPLSVARGLEVGSVLALPGCSVSSVQLIAADGQKMMQAKLGQSGGMRAVRLEAAPSPDMQELGPPMAEAGAGLVMEGAVQDAPMALDMAPDFATDQGLDMAPMTEEAPLDMLGFNAEPVT
jgi:flagellar motor switch protein FliM